MPIYRYRCEACDCVFSALIFNPQAEVVTCERCGSGRLERLPGVPSVVFKGKGFYVTDNHRSHSDGVKSNGSTSKANKANANPADSSSSPPKAATS